MDLLLEISYISLFTLGKSSLYKDERMKEIFESVLCLIQRFREWTLENFGWGSPVWELKCLKYVTLQRGKTITLVIDTSRASPINGPQWILWVLTGTAWKASRRGKRKSGKRGSVYSYLTDGEADAQWASNFHRCLVMTAMQLAWCKHSTSPTLTAQDTVKMLPEKIFVTCVDSFHEADHLSSPGKGWPELAQVDCCFCKLLESIWFKPDNSALHVSSSVCVHMRLPTV